MPNITRFGFDKTTEVVGTFWSHKHHAVDKRTQKSSMRAGRIKTQRCCVKDNLD